MAQDKKPDDSPKDPSQQNRPKSDPQRLRDLINRFSNHDDKVQPTPPAPSKPAEIKPELPKKPVPAPVKTPPPAAPKAAPVPPASSKPAEKKSGFNWFKKKTPQPVKTPLPAAQKPLPAVPIPPKPVEKKPELPQKQAPAAPKASAPVTPAPKVPVPVVPSPKAPAPVAPVPAAPKKVEAGPVKMPRPVSEEIEESWVYRNKKKLVIAVVIVVALFFGGKFLMGLFQNVVKPSLEETMKQQQQAAKEAPISVKGFKVGRFNYEDSLNVLGTIKGAQEVKLSFEVQGVVNSVNYMEGERYEEGALLMSLRQDDILLRLKRAQAAFNKADSQAKVTENEVEESEKLLAMGAIPASTLEKKELERDAARYEAETQRLEMKANEAMLEKSNLYAPSSGMLGEVNIQEGESVSQNTLVGVHINTEFVYAEFGVVERDVQKISIGQKAKVFVDAYPDKTFEGVIENVAPQITGTSRTSTARIRIENPEGLLLPGMFARVRILLYSKKDALVVPTDVVQGDEGDKWVYVVKLNASETAEEVLPAEGGLSGLAALMTKKKTDEEESGDAAEDEGIAEKRPVTVGYTRPDYTQLDAGVTEGEIVVLTGFERLEDGKKIRLVETQEAEL